MLIWTAKFSRKKAVAAVIAMGIVMAALIILMGRMEENTEPPLLTDNTQRVTYLQSLGWEVKPEPVETLQFLLPDTLAEPYLSYNELQTAQGFDLTPCLGKQVSRYTYTVTNYPDRSEGVQANLYICEDRPVAGDICCPGANGFQEALVRSSEDK
ncbi:DUF4830 domain-containing protein [Oscillibacter sp.]|uniref:DUF4830 domain-containing protein n=1 Tax=Oscillibacter sp. TaxID=1945593 RepID=UPI001B41806D|nr:DUF4830 domain-containing protein [Oscillibacter sp.]MBP3508230.1 DUF4830 domain-containing protein [Oscillibacter sp.]